MSDGESLGLLMTVDTAAIVCMLAVLGCRLEIALKRIENIARDATRRERATKEPEDRPTERRQDAAAEPK